MTQISTTETNAQSSFGEAFLVWLKIGCINFGGPAGQIALMHRVVVDEKKWVDEARFLHALNFCMLLPGPEAQKLATYLGWLMHGVRGGLAAGILFVLPGAFVMLGLSLMYALGRGISADRQGRSLSCIESLSTRRSGWTKRASCMPSIFACCCLAPKLKSLPPISAG